MNERDRNWFAPLWRRVLVTAFCAAWSGFEWLVSHDQFWGTLTAGLTGYAVWLFFIRFKPPEKTKETNNGKPQA